MLGTGAQYDESFQRDVDAAFNAPRCPPVAMNETLTVASPPSTWNAQTSDGPDQSHQVNQVLSSSSSITSRVNANSGTVNNVASATLSENTMSSSAELESRKISNNLGSSRGTSHKVEVKKA